MLSLHPQFIEDRTSCNTSVVLSLPEWNAILGELEELESVREYDMQCAGIRDIEDCRFYTICLGRKR